VWGTGLVTLIGGLAGIAMVARSDRRVAGLVGVLVLVGATAVASYGNPRFRTVAEPALLIGVAGRGGGDRPDPEVATLARSHWQSEPPRVQPTGVRHVAERLAGIAGVEAVTLGGSRAAGTATETSDWDFGLYYRGSLDTDGVRALGWSGQVFEPGDWGRIVDGGAWLRIDGVEVDLIYRDLDRVEHWVAEAEAGRFEIQREVGYVGGIATYILVGELAQGEVLAGDLPRPAFPDALAESAPPRWYQLAAGALEIATVHAGRDDRVAALANLTQAILCTAHGRLAAARTWALNEKGVVERAGLGELQRIDELDLRDAIATTSEVLRLPTWR